MIATTIDTIIPTITTRLEPPRIAAPGRGQLVVTVDIPAGCHIQSHAPNQPFLIPTTLELDEVAGVMFGPPVFPTPDTERFDWTPVELDVYRGRVHIVAAVAVAPNTSVSNVTIVVRLRYQACTESAARVRPKLLLQAVPEVKTIKNRMHLDIETPDVEDEATRLETLGARRLEDGVRTEQGTNWVIMADPEGNEFCVCDGGAG